MPDSVPPADEPLHVSRHSWPWRSSELVALGVMFLVCGFLGWLVARLFNLPTPFEWILATTAALASAVVITRTGLHRKRLSSFEITVDATALAVRSDGALSHTHVDTRHLASIGYRRFGSDECFMLYDGSTTARVPLRATREPFVAGLIEALLLDPSLRVSSDARTLFVDNVRPLAQQRVTT